MVGCQYKCVWREMIFSGGFRGVEEAFAPPPWSIGVFVVLRVFPLSLRDFTR